MLFSGIPVFDRACLNRRRGGTQEKVFISQYEVITAGRQDGGRYTSNYIGRD